MAKVQSWQATVAERATSRAISEVEATWAVETDVADRRHLVIRTYGSEKRQDKGTPSQVLHLDRKAAAELLAILVAELPSLD